VVQADCPGLTYDYLERRLGEYVAVTADNTNMMFKSVLAGRKSTIDFHNGWLVRRGRSLGPDGIRCPGHEEDIAHIEDMTRTMAIYQYEKKLEESRLARAAQREAQREQEAIRKQERAANRVLRQQDELARLLHNQQIREERKKKRQQRTLERARKKPALETPSIMGLGNSELVKAAGERFKSLRIGTILSNAVVENTSAPENGKGPRNEKVLSEGAGIKTVSLDMKNEPPPHTGDTEVGPEAFKSSL